MKASAETSWRTTSTASPPIMGKRELLEWAAQVTSVQPCRQYDDLRDGLVLVALAQATYPDDIPERFLRVQKRPGQPREVTKNWELLLRCLHRHAVPAVLCAHEQISKGHARCCFNALVLFYFLQTLASSPGATVSACFSSPVDPRLIQFLHSPQGQQAVQSRQPRTPASSRSVARQIAPCVNNNTARASSEASQSRGSLRYRASRDQSTSRASSRDAGVEDDAPQKRSTVSLPTAQRVLGSPQRISSCRDTPNAREDGEEAATSSAIRDDFVDAELEHVKTMAQLALTQEALRGELQTRVWRNEAAQLKCELEYLQTSRAHLDASARARPLNDPPSTTQTRSHAVGSTQDEVSAVIRTVCDVLDVQISLCQAVLAPRGVHDTAVEAEKEDAGGGEPSGETHAHRVNLNAAVKKLVAVSLPFLETLSMSTPSVALSMRELKSCLYVLGATAETLQLENARLQRLCQRERDAPQEVPVNSAVASASTSVLANRRATDDDDNGNAVEARAARTSLIHRLESAVAEQAHEIAALRTALRHAQQEKRDQRKQQRRQTRQELASTRAARSTASRAQESRVHQPGDAPATPKPLLEHTEAEPQSVSSSQPWLHSRPVNTAAAKTAWASASHMKTSATSPTTSTSPKALLTSAEELERRKAAIFRKYSTLMATHA